MTTFILCVVQAILSIIQNKNKIIHIHNTFGPKRTERRLQKPGWDSNMDESLPITDGLLFFKLFFLNMLPQIKPLI